VNSLKRIFLLIGLAAGGLGISIYQTYHFYLVRSGLQGFKSFCQFGKFDCVAVESSPYAELIFGIPLSAFAAGWFLATIIIAAFAFSEESTKKSLRTLALMSIVSLGFSLVYFGIMATVLNAYCLLCLAIDGINIGIFGLIFTMKSEWMDKWKPQVEDFKTAAIVIPVSLILSIAGTSGAFSNSDVTQSQIDQVANSFVMREKLPYKINADEMSSGPEDAPVTVVKYSDFECPACEMGAKVFNTVKLRFKGRIRFVVRNYPLDNSCNPEVPSRMHPKACDAAKAAVCFSKFGHFMDAYENFFENQKDLGQELYDSLADNLGIDRSKLKECMDDGATLSKIQADIELGKGHNVESTPTFLVNGIKMEGSYPPSVWNAVIQKMIDDKR